MQAPNQGQGLIAECEGRIKKCINSNPAIILYHHPPIDRRLASIPLPNEQVPLQNLTIVLNVVLVRTPQSSLNVDMIQENSRLLDQVEWMDKVIHGP
jgi:hypothetical protein